MNEVDRKYDEWLNEIKGKQPTLTNPEQLTADILQKVVTLKRTEKAMTSGKSVTSKTHSSRLFLLGSWLSGMAATVLLCFFLAEALRMPVKPQSETPGFAWESVPASILPPDWKLMTLTEKRSYLSACLKQQEQQKQLIYKNIENKLLKQMYDENK